MLSQLSKDSTHRSPKWGQMNVERREGGMHYRKTTRITAMCLIITLWGAVEMASQKVTTECCKRAKARKKKKALAHKDKMCRKYGLRTMLKELTRWSTQSAKWVMVWPIGPIRPDLTSWTRWLSIQIKPARPSWSLNFSIYFLAHKVWNPQKVKYNENIWHKILCFIEK